MKYTLQNEKKEVKEVQSDSVFNACKKIGFDYNRVKVLKTSGKTL